MRLWLALAVALAVLLSLGLWSHYFVGAYDDDVVYLSVAHALAQGRGLLEDCSAGSPPHRQYVPGYPLLLTPVWWCASSGPLAGDLARVLSLAFSLLSLLLVYRVAYRELRGPAVLLLGLNSSWAVHSSMAMSDVPYTTLVLLTLACWGRWLPLGLVAGLAAWLRSTGLMLVLPNLLAMLIARRKPREVLTFLATWALVAAPVVLFTGQARQTLSYQRDLWVASHAAFASVIRGNLAIYLPGMGLAVGGDPYAGLSSPLYGLGWLAAVLIVVGGLRHLRRDGPGAQQACTVAAVMGVFMLAVPDFRFVLALYPLWILFYLDGARAMGRRALQLALSAALISELGVVAWELRQPPVLPQLQTFEWVARHTQPQDTLATSRLAVWLYTGRQLLRYREDHAWVFLERFLDLVYAQKAGWLLLYGPENDAMIAWMRGDPRFALAFHSPLESSWVFRVGGSPDDYQRAFQQYEEGLLQVHAGRLDQAAACFAAAAAQVPAAQVFSAALEGRTEALTRFLQERPNNNDAQALAEALAKGRPWTK